MANEKRLIYANELLAIGSKTKLIEIFPNWKELPYETQKAICKYGGYVKQLIQQLPTVDSIPVEQYKALLDMYHDLRENFIDYYCSGTQNVAPYCLNKCEECVDKWGYCKQYSDYCKGFNPAEVIMDGAKMDGSEKHEQI